MVQTVVTPHKKDFNMTVSLPADYVGKEVHVLFYIDEELVSTTSAILPKKKPSDFFGILTEEEGEKMDKHIQQMRDEWKRNI